MKFEFPAHNSKKLFKFQAQDSDLEYLFWKFEKSSVLSEKKPPLRISGHHCAKVRKFQV